MTRRTPTMLVALAVVIAAALLPHPVFASCQLTDPGCYIDDFTHKQFAQFDLSIWQLNRAGLVLARWLEDLRGWLTDSVLTDAFTTLTQPVKFVFYLALIVAWLLFVISSMVQSLIDLNLVNLRRAMRPILLALFIFSLGGSILRGTEYARLLGGTILQQAAADAVQAFQAPAIPTKNMGDMADASASIYAHSTTCGTPARAQAAMFLNDYAARYLWATADDIHCADILATTDEFYKEYFPYGKDISNSNSDDRQKAVAAAAQGGMRQTTGMFMTGGAIIEQFVQMIFALALALVWFGILISLVFAVFVPTEALFGNQIKALIGVLRASWLASFLIGLGLAVLQLVAASGNGLLVFLCGLVLIAITLWQGKQALETMGAAFSAASAATGSAPPAVSGMLRGWATTAALVGGAFAAGEIGAVSGQVGAITTRRHGRRLGNPSLSEASGRVLTNRVASKIDQPLLDKQTYQGGSLSMAEAAWYERGGYDGQGMIVGAATAQRAKKRAGQATVLLARVAPGLRKSGRLGTVAPTQALRTRGGEREEAGTGRTGATQLLVATPVAHTAGQAIQRRAQLEARRNQVREERLDAAPDASHAPRTIEAGAAGSSEPVMAMPADAGLVRPAPNAQLIRPQTLALPERDWNLTVPSETRDESTQLVGARSRFAAREWRVAARPASMASRAEALTQAVPLAAAQPIVFTRSAQGLVANGYAVTRVATSDDSSRVFVTAGGQIKLLAAASAKVLALPIGQTLHVPTPTEPKAPSTTREQRVAATDLTTSLRNNHATAHTSVARAADATTASQHDAPSAVTSRQPINLPTPARTFEARTTGTPPNAAQLASARAAATNGPAIQHTSNLDQQARVTMAMVAAAPLPNLASAAPAIVAARVEGPAAAAQAIPLASAAATTVIVGVPVVPAAPRAVNDLRGRGAAASVATPSAVLTQPIASAIERRPAASPTRAITGLVLPHVAEVPERDDTQVRPEAMPVPSAHQPWKRHKQGNA